MEALSRLFRSSFPGTSIQNFVCNKKAPGYVCGVFRYAIKGQLINISDILINPKRVFFCTIVRAVKKLTLNELTGKVNR